MTENLSLEPKVKQVEQKVVSVLFRRGRTSQFFDILNFFDYKLSISHSPFPLASGGTRNAKIIEFQP